MNAKYSTWISCEFNTVDMSRSDFMGSVFINCKFTKCNFTNCDLSRVLFKKCKSDDDNLLFENVETTDVIDCDFKIDREHFGCLFKNYHRVLNQSLIWYLQCINKLVLCHMLPLVKNESNASSTDLLANKKC